MNAYDWRDLDRRRAYSLASLWARTRANWALALVLLICVGTLTFTACVNPDALVVPGIAILGATLVLLGLSHWYR